MGRGRPRKSDAQKRLEGNPGKRPLGGEAEAHGTPRRPARMSKEAGWLWNLVVQNWMGELDTAELMTLCDTWELLRAATRKAKRDPCNPELRNSFVRYKGEFDKLAARFGMTPADRAKIRIPSEEKADNKEGKYFGVVG
jgi:phage terminase small subunit